MVHEINETLFSIAYFCVSGSIASLVDVLIPSPKFEDFLPIHLTLVQMLVRLNFFTFDIISQ